MPAAASPAPTATPMPFPTPLRPVPIFEPMPEVFFSTSEESVSVLLIISCVSFYSYQLLCRLLFCSLRYSFLVFLFGLHYFVRLLLCCVCYILLRLGIVVLYFIVCFFTACEMFSCAFSTTSSCFLHLFEPLRKPFFRLPPYQRLFT